MGLAAAFHGRGAQVIIGGRTPAKLSAVAARFPGMEVEVIDVADAASVAACAARFGERHPDLNLLINNAGLQQIVDFASGTAVPPEVVEREIATNFTGLVHVSSALLPLLLRQPKARIINIGSGLAYVPLVAAPIYSATKAAVHAFTIALRTQLLTSPVQVIEIIPPVVETDLHKGQTRMPKGAMPLDAFVKATMAGLDAGRSEIPVGLANVPRIGSRVAPGFFLNVINKAR